MQAQALTLRVCAALFCSALCDDDGRTERMGVAAQLEKRAVLDALRARFVRMPLAGEARVRWRRAACAQQEACCHSRPRFRVLGFDRGR
jgi:hypothetical protein